VSAAPAVAQADPEVMFQRIIYDGSSATPSSGASPSRTTSQASA
jgi:hypothetical protein